LASTWIEKDRRGVDLFNFSGCVRIQVRRWPAGFFLVFLAISVGRATQMLRVKPSPAVPGQEKFCPYEIAANECNRCPLSSSASGCVAQSNCSSCQVCCLAIYFANGASLVAPVSLTGRNRETEQRASARSERPPVPPPRVAFS